LKRSIAVTIAGQKYTIRSDAEERYVHNLATIVDRKIKEIGRATKSANTQSLAVLAALQLADALTREKEARASLRDRVREKSKTLREYLDRELKT
jgi:cell division protein ZapA